MTEYLLHNVSQLWFAFTLDIAGGVRLGRKHTHLALCQMLGLLNVVLVIAPLLEHRVRLGGGAGERGRGESCIISVKAARS